MKPLSLKMRAIALLSQREHSPIELRRKLLRIARATRSDLEDEASGEMAGEAVNTEVDALLAWLQAQGYLSETRFVESRLHARAQRYGSLRIKQELAQHGLALGEQQQAELKATEFERAQAIWQRKFGQASSDQALDPALRAKQIRFLTARGFAPDVVRQVLRAAGER